MPPLDYEWRVRGCAADRVGPSWIVLFVALASLISNDRASAAGRTVDVREFGAVGDGMTNDSRAVAQAIRALPEAGGTVQFPPGVFAIGDKGIVISRSNVTLQGSGRNESVLRRIGSGPLLQSAASASVQHHLCVEGLGFQGDRSSRESENTASIALYGEHISNVRFSQCRFVNSPAVAIAMSSVQHAVIEECAFESTGDARGTAINLSRSCGDITITRSSFRYLRDGIVVDTGNTKKPAEYPMRKLVVTGNQFDLGWWLIKETSANEGDSVSYTANALRDTNANFKNLQRDARQNIRVLSVKQTGRARFSTAALDDSEAHFISNGVKAGHLVRAAGVFAVATSVPSETSVMVESWLSRDDYQPVTPPPAGTTYTAYGILLGQVRDFSSTTVTTTRWWDFDGNSVTPPAGARYEILLHRPNYALHVEAGTQDTTVSNNTFKRGWSDQVSIWGDNAVIADNVIEDGEDMGITLHGRGHRVTGNRISHQGAGGIWMTADDSVVEKNHITDSQWVNNFNDNWLGDIIIDDGNRNTIAANLCERLSSVLAHNGIVIAARKAGSTGNIIKGNVSRGHLKAGIRFTREGDARVSHTVLEDNEGDVIGRPKTDN